MKRAIHIIPELGDFPEIENFRRRFDRLHPCIAAHITLVFPFDLPLTDEALLQHCGQCASEFQCFTIQLLPPQRSADDYLCLPVSHSTTLQELTNRLHTGPLTVPALSRERGDFHITLARPPLSPSIESALRQDLSRFPVSIEVTAITLEAIQPDENSLILGHFPLQP